MSPQDVGLVLGTLLNAAEECEVAATRNSMEMPAFAEKLLARAKALHDVANRLERTMLYDLQPQGHG